VYAGIIAYSCVKVIPTSRFNLTRYMKSVKKRNNKATLRFATDHSDAKDPAFISVNIGTVGNNDLFEGSLVCWIRHVNEESCGGWRRNQW
jgi:ethanolamine ammonia-lyase small subunit